MNREEYYASLREYKDNVIQHWGILGQKWGIRRYQNPDGTLTPAGRERYLNKNGEFTKSGAKKYEKDLKKDQKKNGKFYDKKEKAIESGDVKFAYKYRKMFSDDDFNRLESVINEKQKYANLVNRANQMRMNKIRAYTDIMNLSLQTANNITGLANNVMGLTNRLSDSGKNNDNYEALTVDSNGKPISRVHKFTGSDGTKMSVTTLYNKNEPKSSSEVNKSWSFATDDKKKKK